MKKHGPNSENISQAVLRLGKKQWRFRAPLTFLHATIGIEPQTLLPESSALTTRPPRQTLKLETMLGRIHYSSTTLGCFKKNHFSSYQKVSFRLGVFLEVIYWTEFDFSLSLLFWVSKLNIWVYFQSFNSNFFSFLYDIAYLITALNHPHPICRTDYFSL